MKTGFQTPATAKVVFALLLSLSMCGIAAAQCQSNLMTTYAGGNGCSGNFFDVVVSTNVTVCSFDVHLGTTNMETMEVWAVTGGGSYVPVSGNSAAWTLLATVTVPGGGIGVPTPLNLNLQYLIPSGTTQGFLIRDTTSTNIDYTNGGTVGATLASNADLSILEGNYTCTTGTTFPVLTSATRQWNGTIHYSTSNQLSVTQSGPGVGDLIMTLADVSTTAGEGWTLLSTNTSQAVATGPAFGLFPDPITFTILGYPYFPGSPFHFNAGDVGLWPNTTFVAGPGALSALSGQTLDFVVVFLTPGNAFDSTSNVARLTFQ